jgi:hypothetical protein
VACEPGLCHPRVGVLERGLAHTHALKAAPDNVPELLAADFHGRFIDDVVAAWTSGGDLWIFEWMAEAAPYYWFVFCSR